MLLPGGHFKVSTGGFEIETHCFYNIRILKTENHN